MQRLTPGLRRVLSAHFQSNVTVKSKSSLTCLPPDSTGRHCMVSTASKNTTGCVNQELGNFKDSRYFSTVSKPMPAADQASVGITFQQPNGKTFDVQGKVGDTLLDLVVKNEIPLDGYGACEGTLACSTCHVVLDKAAYSKLPDKPSDEELDMLDLAYGLTDTSRLGCQITLTKDLDGLVIKVPDAVNDARQG